MTSLCEWSLHKRFFWQKDNCTAHSHCSFRIPESVAAWASLSVAQSAAHSVGHYVTLRSPKPLQLVVCSEVRASPSTTRASWSHNNSAGPAVAYLVHPEFTAWSKRGHKRATQVTRRTDKGRHHAVTAVGIGVQLSQGHFPVLSPCLVKVTVHYNA